MPIYEYECKECGQRFEKMQPVTAEPLTECINCGKGPVRRVFHPVGVIFKGSGWYVTDSRKNTSSGANESKSDSSAATGGSTTSTAKSEKAADAD
jgi:putative FmdB family regulatory protein